MTTPLADNSGGGDEDIVLLSALNDYLYCPRRAWLHRVEGVFTHTAETLEGSHAHQRTDKPSEHHRDGVRIVHGLPLYTKRLGLVGKADTVEFHPSTEPDQPVSSESRGLDRPYPVEYKHGRKRKWDNDDAQLCAQAFCLEEMFGLPVPAGAIFHIASKRRREVLFNEALRNLTLEAIAGIRRMLSTGRIPPPIRRPRCRGCSLNSLCMPSISADCKKVTRYVKRLYKCNSSEEGI